LTSIVYDGFGFSDLKDLSRCFERSHPPIPEGGFDSFDTCVASFELFARTHGLLYSSHHWKRDATRLQYKAEVRYSLSHRRRMRMGAVSAKTKCLFKFYLAQWPAGEGFCIWSIRS
jgi:hypothetical protein